MKRRYKVAAVIVIVMLAVSIGLNIALAGNQQADPGSDQDPIVSKSYVDAVFTQLSPKVQLLLEQYDAMKSLSTQMAAKLTEQEKTIKALRDELNALKSGIPASSSSQGTSTGGSTSSGQPEQTSKAVVNVAVLNVRSGPGTTTSIIAKLVKNETVTIISKSGDWYKIKTSKGQTGYVMGKYVTLQK
ncbi:MAG: SH3 domain-containing protein [Bacillota bacterium]